ncbi:SDR family NAD(P)-dependent oxidoreductase [Arenibaculum sp.]|jgi:short-subunit dehydrogenase|uniref:SDR family NAD(P)-dependent oxidoreductase n=1 Tax=Arenibaculum sp. TaxID=2865862 RepID=UPI002E1051C3|nr:SDR family NAD(P)-dependent oxidoreductase [Arenibaculum sp.]
MVRPVRDRVAVVTGASSGVGRAVARAFADRGTRLVLAARRAAPLDRAVRECITAGAPAIAVPTDVTVEEEVEHLAHAAMETYGRLDLWVHAAGVGAFGRLEDLPAEVWYQVVETNLLGAAFGARTAIRRFRRQGSGTLVTLASVAGRVGEREAAAYVASQAGVLGLAAALREELRDQPGIRVCTVVTGAVDTPFYQHAANFSGRRVRPGEPVTSPEAVAAAVVGLAVHPRDEVAVGRAARLAALGGAIGPRLAFPLAAARLGRPRSPEREAPHSGALFEPMREGTGAHGGWHTGHAKPSRGLLLLAAAAFAVLPFGALALSRRGRT